MEGPAGEREATQLRLRGRDQAWVAVAEVQRRVRRQQVEVAATLGVGDPRALALHQRDRERVVGVRGIALLEPDGIRGGGHRRSLEKGHEELSHDPTAHSMRERCE